MSNFNDSSALTKLQRSFTEGAIGRREFLAGATAIGVSLSAANVLVARPAQAAPKKGGRFRVAVTEGKVSDSLNPETTTNQSQIFLAHTIRNYLTEIGPNNDLIPELAVSWEANSDATQWNFKLRKGVEFHNGKTMDADDVVASINLHRGEETKSAAKVLLDAVAEIKADGKDAVTFKLKGGNADFPQVMTDYHLTIQPSDGEGGSIWQGGMGTGAYVVNNFEPGVRAFLTRSPNYWKEGRGHFDELEVLPITDPNARQTALMTGELDAMDGVQLNTAHLLERHDETELDNVTSWAHITFPVHTDISPFDSNDVRLALKYAIDREELVSKILHGYGSVGNDQPISSSIQFYAELPQRTYDPDKARFHLKKAGLDKLQVSLSTSDAVGPGMVDSAILYKERAAKAGLDIEVVREPSQGYYSDVWLKKPFCMVFWGGRPTADVMFTTAYAAGADWNESHFKHERFNKLLTEARAELDTAKRAEMYREMQIILKDEGGTVIPMFRNHVFARRSNVQHGPDLSGNWQLDGNRAAERWWFA